MKKIKKTSFFDKRSTQYGSNTVLMIIALFGILVLVNFIAQKEVTRIDLTKNQLYSLSDQSEKVLDQVTEPVRIIAFYRDNDPQRSDIENVIREYTVRNENINFEFVDPDKNPSVATQYQINRYNTIILEKDGKTEQANSISESDITSAILRLVKEETKKIYFITGHGEKSFDPTNQNKSYALIKQELEKQIYEVNELSLISEPEVPEDASVVVLAGPTVALAEEEKSKLKAYINDKNGKVFFLLDPVLDSEKTLEMGDFFNEFGIDYQEGIVIDRTDNYFGDVSAPLIQEFTSHQITQRLDGAFFPGTAKVGEAENIPENWQITELAASSSNSWLEKNITTTQAEFNEGEDEEGPIPFLVVAQEITPSDTKAEGQENTEDSADKARMVVFGDSDFVLDPITDSSTGQFNKDLFINAINWLAAEEDLISISPKEIDTEQVTLTGNQARYIFYVTVAGMPIAVAAIGVYVISRRKKKRKK